MLAQGRTKGAEVLEQTQEMEGVGRSGWVADRAWARVTELITAAR
jgi:hypothetical protein